MVLGGGEATLIVFTTCCISSNTFHALLITFVVHHGIKSLFVYIIYFLSVTCMLLQPLCWRLRLVPAEYMWWTQWGSGWIILRFEAYPMRSMVKQEKEKKPSFVLPYLVMDGQEKEKKPSFVLPFLVMVGQEKEKKPLLVLPFLPFPRYRKLRFCLRNEYMYGVPLLCCFTSLPELSH